MGVNMNCCSKIFFNALKVSLLCGISLTSVEQAMAGGGKKAWNKQIEDMETFDRLALRAFCQKKSKNAPKEQKEKWEARSSKVLDVQRSGMTDLQEIKEKLRDPLRSEKEEALHKPQPLPSQEIFEGLEEGGFPSIPSLNSDLNQDFLEALKNVNLLPDVTTTTTCSESFVEPTDSENTLVGRATYSPLQAQFQESINELRQTITNLRIGGATEEELKPLIDEMYALNANFPVHVAEEPSTTPQPDAHQQERAVQIADLEEQIASCKAAGIPEEEYVEFVDKLRELSSNNWEQVVVTNSPSLPNTENTTSTTSEADAQQIHKAMLEEQIAENERNGISEEDYLDLILEYSQLL